MKYVIPALCAVIPMFALGACQTFTDDAESSVANQPEATQVEVPPPKSWIGASLRNQHEYGEEIRDYPSFVKIDGTLPETPAHDVLQDDDVLLSVDGHPVTTAQEVVAIVSERPVGVEVSMVVRRKKKEVTVRLRTEARPTYEEYLQKMYVGKPIPSLQKHVSVAAVRKGGGIVPESQCVMGGKKECPPFGRAGKTDLSVGKATVVLFPKLWNSRFQPVFPLLMAWDTRYGQKGLKIVTVTTDPPSLIAEYLAESDIYPPMSVLAISILERGALEYIEKASPSMLILDEDGMVRATCLRGEEGFSESCERMVIELLGETQ